MKRTFLTISLCLAASSAHASKGRLERSKHATKASWYSAILLANSYITYAGFRNTLVQKKSLTTKGINLYVLGLLNLTSFWAAKNAFKEYKKAFSRSKKKDSHHETN